MGWIQVCLLVVWLVCLYGTDCGGSDINDMDGRESWGVMLCVESVMMVMMMMISCRNRE